MLNGAAPAFDPQGGIALMAARGLWLVALLSGAGTLAVLVRVLPAARDRAPADAAAAGARLLMLARGSLVAALLAGVAWLVLQSADLGDAESLLQALAVVPTVLGQTRFGPLLLLQLAVLAGALLAIAVGRRRPGAAALLAALAVAAQAGHGHAAAMADPALLAAGAIHALAAAGWLGGLVPLLLVVRDTPPRAGAAAARAFAGMGWICVLALIGSAAVQAYRLIGDVPGLLGTAYGWVVVVKAALLGMLLWFAARNRYRFAPALRQATPERARARLVRSIAMQTAFGLGAVAATTVLTSLPPSMHLQPVWPFAWRPSLDTVREDPDVLRETVLAGLALAGATGLLGLALPRRRWVLAATALAALIAWQALPHLELLFVPAGPTSYDRSPTRFAAASILRGIALYPAHCAACHGPEGRGDGPAASAGTVPPADLTAPHLWGHRDGELFGWLSDGIPLPDGPGLAMPGFAAVLSEADRWALIDAIRARNAGLARGTAESWPWPLAAPDFSAQCPDGPGTLAGWRGQVVRLVVGPSPGPDRPPAVSAGPVAAAGCAAEPATAGAYAAVAGLPPDRLIGTEFLIDAEGWLRRIRPPGAPDWDGVGLAEAVARLRAAPLPPGASGGGMDMAM